MPESPIQAPPSAPSSGLPGKVPWYLWPNLLSLDAVAVAVVWLWCFSIWEQVPLLRAVYLVLGLVVWIIYTFDRLSDALRMADPDRSTPRHRFAWRYYRPLLALWVLALALAIYLILFDLQRVLIYHGLVISMMVVAYFVLRSLPMADLHHLLPKEVFCGFIFALGSTYPVYALPDNFGIGMLSAELLFFALLCALNCTAISVWEWREDAANDESATIVKLWPMVRQGYPKFAFVLAVVAVWLAARGSGGVVRGAEQASSTHLSPILLSVALSAALIGAIGLTGEALSRNLRRLLADLALLSPLVIVPLLGG